MDGSPPKTNRKVRFSLPEPAVPAVPSTTPVQKQRMAHGTMQYVNGTLISQSQQTAATAAQTRAHQSLQITPTPTSATASLHASSAGFKPKELNNKIVLHLRPSVSSLDSGSELSSPKGSPGSSNEAKTARQKAFAQKAGNNSSTSLSGGTGASRSLKSLPSINQKFPSSEDVNNNAGSRQRSGDDLGGLWNHPTKKPTIILRTIASSGSQTHPAKAPLTARTRAKSMGKLPGGVAGPAGRQSKSLISPHLAPMDGALARGQDSTTHGKSGEMNGGGGDAKDRRIEEINVSSIIRQSGQPAGNGSHRSMYGKGGQFLAVPEYTDRYEGMETAVSATLNDEEEDEFEDSEQDGSGGGGSGTGTGDERNGTTAGDQSANGNDLLKGGLVDDGKFRCARDTNLGRDRNTAQFWDFVERWRTNRALKKLESANHEPSAPVSTTVLMGSDRGKPETKSPTLSSRIRALRMSLEQVPTVTTLLRASRDANEYLLKEVFRDILENGISKENLNSTDRSGRTAISYICSTNLTNFLELFLQLPGIDVNKPDNEGNTPLHFAAQAGLSDVVNMLITKCRSLIIDPKNNLGFTPLMKAALQGRTRCAKLLLFAGASPVETDTGRGFRAEQWARFCGRHTCAETIEQCARARLLDKSTPCGRWSHDINLPVDKNALKARSCSITPQPTQNGFRSKFRKVFPFNFNSSKDTKAVVSKEGEENYTKDLVNYLKSATLCVSGPALSANRKIIQSLIRPLEVPKLEVTYANNNALIKKYEASLESNGSAETVRRASVDGSTTDSRNGTPSHSPVPVRAKVRN
ncbi:uncharacterized protein LOC121592880 [Anopheles merus]|uniref:uncharacterized protein LOC121592880 n=1 Tax=Anopheles merus TaxID=30066 RepID=UPI001BE45EEB|nr:uncharacterized protein LOC121592880 [Anopheles merus]XP_041770675.1 uncharacterized protein LOC121592880 [Anopheles merus]XP_041770676.1 uncharacterized protein LOC121592880 [Anopheles merus]